MQVAFLLYDDMTALDAAGPFDALSRLPDSDIVFCARHAGPVRTQHGFLTWQADRSIDEVAQADVIVVPGGSPRGLKGVMADTAVLDWVRRMHQGTRYTASVCTGSLILLAAGIARGATVSTHWRAKEMVPRLGGVYSAERVTLDGKLITSAGVTAGIDLGLRLCGLLAGDDIGAAVELGMEYAPEPPYGTGNASRATPELRDLVNTALRP